MPGKLFVSRSIFHAGSLLSDDDGCPFIGRESTGKAVPAMMPGADDIIVVRNMSKQFGPVWALRCVSMSVKRGSVVVIIGPSGSGKSTLLRCMNHMELEDEGEVLIDGHLLTKTKIKSMRSGLISAWFSSTSTFILTLTVLENITLAQHIVRKIDKAEPRTKLPGSSSNGWHRR